MLANSSCDIGYFPSSLEPQPKRRKQQQPNWFNIKLNAVFYCYIFPKFKLLYHHHQSFYIFLNVNASHTHKSDRGDLVIIVFFWISDFDDVFFIVHQIHKCMYRNINLSPICGFWRSYSPRRPYAWNEAYIRISLACSPNSLDWFFVLVASKGKRNRNNI